MFRRRMPGSAKRLKTMQTLIRPCTPARMLLPVVSVEQSLVQPDAACITPVTDQPQPDLSSSTSPGYLATNASAVYLQRSSASIARDCAVHMSPAHHNHTSAAIYQSVTAAPSTAATRRGDACDGHGRLTKQNSKPKRKRIITCDQRKAANIRERKRMLNLNEAFEMLRKSVPTFSYEKKLSRIETLRLAITYIEFLNSLLEGSEPHNLHMWSYTDRY